MSTGRNEPCPCGSGRKFKHCCGAPTAATNGPPSHADRDAAFDLLDHLAGLPRFEDDLLAAHAMIWSFVEDEEARSQLMDTVAGDLFTEWVWFDHLCHTGETLAEYALARHTTELTPGGRRFLRACIAAPLRLLQVARVEPGERVHLRDVADRGPVIAVSERSGSHVLLRHDVLAGRVVDYDGERQLEGVVATIPLDDKAIVLGEMRRLRRRIVREFPEGAVQERLLRMATGVAIVTCTIELCDRPLPRLTTTDGEAMQFATAVFDMADADAVEHALDAAPDLERDEPSADDGGRPRYTWFDALNVDLGFRRILGGVVVGDATLRVETMSMERARRAQAHFGALAPAVLRFMAIDVQSLESLRRQAPVSEPEPRTDAPELRQIESAFLEQHYRAWLDLPVPALEGYTPREAARLKPLRATLRTLVEGIENQAERGAREGGGFDAAFLREELGLRRR